MRLWKRVTPAAAEITPPGDSLSRLEVIATGLARLIEHGATFPGYTAGFAGNRAVLRRDHDLDHGIATTIYTSPPDVLNIQRQEWYRNGSGDSTFQRVTSTYPVSGILPVTHSMDWCERDANGDLVVVTTSEAAEAIRGSVTIPVRQKVAAALASGLQHMIEIAQPARQPNTI